MASTPKLIVVKSSDGETFEVEEEVANQSQTIKHLIEDDCADTVIPLPNVNAKIMAKVIDYCKHYAKPSSISSHYDVDKPSSSSSHNNVVDKDFDLEFMEPVKGDQRFLYDLLLAANYLNVKSLLDLLFQAIADMIKGKSPQEIRDTFHIKNDFSPEVEEQVRKENAWAYE